MLEGHKSLRNFLTLLLENSSFSMNSSTHPKSSKENSSVEYFAITNNHHLWCWFFYRKNIFTFVYIYLIIITICRKCCWWIWRDDSMLCCWCISNIFLCYFSSTRNGMKIDEYLFDQTLFSNMT